MTFSVDLSDEQCQEIRRVAVHLNNHVRETVQSPARTQLRVSVPTIETWLADISELTQKLGSGLQVEDSDLPLIKSVITHARRELAASVEDREARTHNPSVADRIREQSAIINELAERDWYYGVEARRIPKLTDALTIQIAQDILDSQRDGGLRKPEFDDKFRILLAPSLFLTDLSYFRAACGLREVGVSVAFIDIDDFKTFNKKYGNSYVDQQILPLFMSALEAHVFMRGRAYRQGGDEFLATIPNTSEDAVARIWSEFQRKVHKLEFQRVDERIQVSVGVCQVSPDCPLTDREVRSRAGLAAEYAKGSGKNCVAAFSGPHYRDCDVRVLEPRSK